MTRKLLGLLFVSLLLVACGGGEEIETDTGGGSSGSNGSGSSGSTETTTGSEDAAPESTFNLSGTWTDTDLVGSNSCGLAIPAPGSSRVTPGIVIEQAGDRITLTSPPNVLGTRTVATGSIASDGVMVLTGNDGDSTITLNFQATSNDMITGSSQVMAGGCTYNFTNSLVRTG